MSHSQIGGFVSHPNNYVQRGPRNSFPGFPNNKFQGEPVKVSFIESSANDDLSKSLFLSKCVAAIQKTVEKSISMGLDYTVVVPFIKFGQLHRIMRTLEAEEHVCYDRFLSFAQKNETRCEKRGTKTGKNCPVVFCQPFEIEGCEFPILLVIIDGETFQSFTFPLYGSKFFSAVTRASLKVEIMVKYFEIQSDDFVDNILIDEQRIKTEKFLGDLSQIHSKNRMFYLGVKCQNPPDEIPIKIASNFQT